MNTDERTRVRGQLIMFTAFRKRFSRRRLFAFTGGLVATVLAACSSDSNDDTDDDSESPEPSITPTPQATPSPTAAPSPTATPTAEPTPEPASPVRYWIDPGIPNESTELTERIVDAIRRGSSDPDSEPEAVDRESDADVRVRQPGGGDDEILIYGEALIPVAAVDQLAPGLTSDQLVQLFDGSISNWIEVEGQDREVTPVIHPSAETLGITGEIHVASPEELAQHAGESPGLIALVPRSLVSFHVQSLYVDEIDPLREELRPDSWPWWEQLAVKVEPRDGESSRQQLIDEIEELNVDSSAPRRTMLSAVGDVALGRTVHTIMTEQDDWRAPFTLVDDELQRGDLTIGNLECAITGSFAPPEDPRTFSFMTFPQAVEGLEFAGFTALSGANNHAMDFGVTGMRDTTAALAERGIQHFGTGDNLSAAREPCLLEHDGNTFALLGYDSISMNYAAATAESGGISPMIQEYVLEDIQRARERADVVIPFFHWGVEYTLTPTEADRQMAHAAIDAGADLVLGGHPHWVQGMEVYQNRPIFYSLSNFVFDQEWSLETKQGFVLHLIFDGASFVGYRVVPVLIEDFHRPRVVEDDIRATILGRFWESSRAIASS